MSGNLIVAIVLVLALLCGAMIALQIRRLEKRDFFVGPRWMLPVIFITGLTLLFRGVAEVGYFLMAISLPTCIWIGKDGWNNHRRANRRPISRRH